MRTINYIVNNEDNGKSLLEIMKNEMRLSGYQIRKNKHFPNAVTVNGNHANVNTVVYKNDYISIQISDTEYINTIIPTPGPLNILFEDEDIIVLNKRAEDIVHPDHAHIDNTLGNYLMYYFMNKNELANFHPVQRLDNGTSGLIVFAKHAYAQNILSAAMHTADFERTYLAICTGIISEDSGIIDSPIKRIDSNSIKRYVDKSGQNAQTEYVVLERYEYNTLVKLKLKTGRTHQIRVHMSHIGHPLVGDTLYGGRVTENIMRPALHSNEINFTHPISFEKIILTAPLPQDIAAEINSYS